MATELPLEMIEVEMVQENAVLFVDPWGRKWSLPLRMCSSAEVSRRLSKPSYLLTWSLVYEEADSKRITLARGCIRLLDRRSHGS